MPSAEASARSARARLQPLPRALPSDTGASAAAGQGSGKRPNNGHVPAASRTLPEHYAERSPAPCSLKVRALTRPNTERQIRAL